MKTFCLVFTCMLFLLYACSERKPENHIHHEHSEAIADTLDKVYWCPMDTQIVSDTPGTCPICSMDLEPKPQAMISDSGESDDWVLAPVNGTVLSSVAVATPMEKEMNVFINVNGKVSYDERRINTISSKISGRIEKLYIKYIFQPVKKNQALFDIFSHELQTAQEEYLSIKKNEGSDSELLKVARKKLLLLGMTESQVNQLKDHHHANSTTTVYSPYDGYVLEQTPSNTISTPASSGSMESMKSESETNSSTASREISLREGVSVRKGEPLFSLVNTDLVWAILEVGPEFQEYIKPGQTVRLASEFDTTTFVGKVNFIEPQVAVADKRIRFRVHLDNAHQKLKIGYWLSGEISGPPKKARWIPETSVYDLGASRIVFVKESGAFHARRIKTGVRSKGFIEVLDGLSDKSEIAFNAQFMVDSESFIKTSN